MNKEQDYDEPQLEIVENSGDRESDHSKLMAAYDKLDRKINLLLAKKKDKKRAKSA